MVEARRAEPVTTETQPTDEQPLRVADRCDRCGARAFVRAVFDRGELLFCAHHFTKNEIEIVHQAIAITDERERLHEKETASV